MNAHLRGIVAVILSIGVATAVVITAIGAAWHKGPIAQSESSLLSTVLGAAVGAVAVYLGGTELRRSSSSSPAEQASEHHEEPPDPDLPEDLYP